MKLLRLLIAVMILALALPFAAQGKARKPFKPHTRHLINLAHKRQEAAVIAWHFLGVPYVWGGSSPRGFDCSGLVAYVMRRVGIDVPHWTGWQIRLGVAVAWAQRKVGDAVFFHGGEHVGLLVNRNHYVEAPHTGAVVRIRRLERGAVYAIRRFV